MRKVNHIIITSRQVCIMFNWSRPLFVCVLLHLFDTKRMADNDNSSIWCYNGGKHQTRAALHNYNYLVRPYINIYAVLELGGGRRKMELLYFFHRVVDYLFLLVSLLLFSEVKSLWH